MNSMNNSCICPECKNSIDLSTYSNVAPKHVIECNVCGITLEIAEIKSDGTIVTDIVDEGK